MYLDYGVLPPEINSGRMYAGPGSGSLLSAASAWDQLATEYHSAAVQYGSTISKLTTGQWTGPSSVAMAAAAQTYVAWLHTTAVQAEQTAGQAKAAAAAHSMARAAVVPPSVIASNRSLLTALIAHNFFGQYTAAIGETERQYAQMWAQDAAAMQGYARSCAAASKLTPFSAPTQNTNPAGQAAQSASVAQVSGGAAGTSAQSMLSQLASPLTSAAGASGSSSNATSALGSASIFSGFAGQAYGNLIGTYSSSADVLSNLNNGIGLATFTAENPAGLFEALNPPFVGPAALSLGGPGLAASAGQAIKIGALSVPPAWAMPVSAITPASVTVPIASPAPAVAAGLPGAAFGETMLGTLAGRGLGGATARVVSRRRGVVPRSPAAG
ncbi:PPE family protein [Mycobacterium sp.]|uniref:PPE family protein n=1 Tax=Mycobacterium sp. TaxID=1785 RepID=UPI0031E32551